MMYVRKRVRKRGAPKSSDIFGAKFLERGSVLPPMTNDHRINDASKFVSLENVHSESTFCDNEAIID
jgi:hypothetical protein